MPTRLEQLLELLAAQPDEPFILFALAKEYEKVEPAEALAFYEKTLEKDPGYLGAYFHRGQLLAELGETDLAIECFDQGIAKAKASGDHHALSELMNARTNASFDL
ncbi:MAG: tetratricopeptide repeat protein [Lewinellaceae bacterium]|nr:tetratricopeptide repeat protein [Saprospiraceae bacterium]MCB9268916.1 tetratricopeptide repeat protein [Lewinellaceae bacterium]HPQ98592.1 tetratricopeptide repeat protein [Saprospiraceae bacterium]HQU55627.1 tetratricopeptide repeat protein [Saprospiraceae bacterium]